MPADPVRECVGMGVQFHYAHANDFLKIGEAAFANASGCKPSG